MHGNPGAADALAREIARVNQLTRSMLEEYVSWSSKISYGETYYVLYGDMLDFVNFRMETADSCLLMIERRKIADSLGLSRGLAGLSWSTICYLCGCAVGASTFGCRTSRRCQKRTSRLDSKSKMLSFVSSKRRPK